jgi:hypothetical protein
MDKGSSILKELGGFSSSKVLGFKAILRAIQARFVFEISTMKYKYVMQQNETLRKRY